jgi:rRNA maturation endonuclease Nob1
MKIIEDNYNYTKSLRTYRITCDSCKSIFECDDGDFCLDYFNQCIIVHCPLCSKYIYIEKE